MPMNTAPSHMQISSALGQGPHISITIQPKTSPSLLIEGLMARALRKDAWPGDRSCYLREQCLPWCFLVPATTRSGIGDVAGREMLSVFPSAGELVLSVLELYNWIAETLIQVRCALQVLSRAFATGIYEEVANDHWRYGALRRMNSSDIPRSKFGSELVLHCSLFYLNPSLGLSPRLPIILQNSFGTECHFITFALTLKQNVERSSQVY